MIDPELLAGLPPSLKDIPIPEPTDLADYVKNKDAAIALGTELWSNGVTAAALLGADPAHCVAIEDSPTGVAAALASGCATLGVPHVVDLEPAPGLTIAGTLTVDKLSRLQGYLLIYTAMAAVLAVAFGGSEWVRRGSTTATSGSIKGLRMLTLTRCRGESRTAFRVTSAPVPAVVGMAI